MTDFSQIIQDLSAKLGITLEASQGSVCKIHVKNSFFVQIEYLENRNLFIIASFIGNPTAGAFRQEVFLQALKASNYEESSISLAYSEKVPSLALQQLFPSTTSSPVICQEFSSFLEKVQLWKEALDQGSLASITLPPPSSYPSPLFLHS